MRCIPLAAITLAATLSAQDMVGVTWTGGIVAFDSYTGASTTLGSAALGQNSLARTAAGTLWSTQRTGAAVPYTYHLATIDPLTGTGTVVFNNINLDIRGMASAGGNLLWCAVNQSTNADSLALLDTSTGIATTIGNMNFAGVQSLAVRGGVLYAWDINQGLLTVSTVTGAATDVNPAYTTGGANIQWLAVRGDGQLVGGNTNLYSIDLATGVPTQIGTGLGDMRGAEPWQGNVRSFGSACNGVFGPTTLTVTGTAAPLGTLTFDSGGHAPVALGFLVLGLSNQSAGALPLPANLDQLLGTQGCTLYTSLDATLLAFATPATPANLVHTLGIPPFGAGLRLYAQQVCLEPVAGGMSWSDAAIVQIGF